MINNYSLEYKFRNLSLDENKNLKAEDVKIEIDEDYSDFEERVKTMPGSKQAIQTIQNLGEWEKKSIEYRAAQANGSIGSELTTRTVTDQQEWEGIEQAANSEAKESRLDDLEEDWDAYMAQREAKNTEAAGLFGSIVGYFSGS